MRPAVCFRGEGDFVVQGGAVLGVSELDIVQECFALGGDQQRSQFFDGSGELDLALGIAYKQLFGVGDHEGPYASALLLKGQFERRAQRFFMACYFHLR